MTTINAHKQILHDGFAKHRPKTNEIHVYSACEAKFKAWTSLSRHTEIKHSNVINFPCKECGKLFARMSRKQHLSKTCSLC